MELANTLNHAGCIFYERERYDEAHDAFCGALQALVISNGELKLTRRRKELLLLDPCIHRAYDRIQMAGLFQSSMAASPAPAVRHCQQEDVDDDENDSQWPSSSTARPPHRAQHQESVKQDVVGEEEWLIKPIMIPFAPWMNSNSSNEEEAFDKLVHPETRQQHFAAAMAVVWMNKGLVLQQGKLRNLSRSLNCYALAGQWLSSLDELKDSTMVQGLSKALSYSIELALLELHQGRREE